MSTILYHGTSLSNGERIRDRGLEESSHGLLGPGVYLAEYSKACAYARDAQQRGKGDGAAIVKVRVTARPGKIRRPPSGWQGGLAPRIGPEERPG
jgi:hypothetical protein